VKSDGGVTKITFKGNTGMECVDWRSTGRITGTNTNGSPTYEKTCAQRQPVHNEVSSIEISTKYVGGISPGVSITTVNQFPVVVSKGSKTVAVLGIAVK
jgi:hypothetical protein